MDPIRLVVRPRDATPGDPRRSTAVGGARGPGGLPVRRTLPERGIAAIGAWCLLEHFGDPDTAPRLLETPARPEAGLQSLTLPTEGLVRRRDNVGNDHLVRHGGVWLSTSGRGRSIAESGIDDPRGGRHAGRFLHGVRLAAALPTAARGMPEQLQVIPDPPLVSTPTMRATILVGGLAGDHQGAFSPALTHTPLLAANVTLATGTERLALDPAFEHGVLLLAGQVSTDGTPLLPGELAYLPRDGTASTWPRCPAVTCSSSGGSARRRVHLVVEHRRRVARGDRRGSRRLGGRGRPLQHRPRRRHTSRSAAPAIRAVAAAARFGADPGSLNLPSRPSGLTVPQCRGRAEPAKSIKRLDRAAVQGPR